jgi:hypothetical protein
VAMDLTAKASIPLAGTLVTPKSKRQKRGE